MLFIAISGGNIVEIWMGKEYRYDLLILVLALGHLCTMSHLSVYDILVGLNHHGPTAKANLLSSLIFISGAYILFKFMGGSLLAVAALLGITLFILDGIWLPIFFARKLKINIYSFYNDTWKIPLLANLPFVVFLCFSSYYFEGIKSLIFDVTIGSFVLFITYWILIIPANLKSKLFPLVVRHS
jgi:hypothetical protein